MNTIKNISDFDLLDYTEDDFYLDDEECGKIVSDLVDFDNLSNN